MISVEFHKKCWKNLTPQFDCLVFKIAKRVQREGALSLWYFGCAFLRSPNMHCFLAPCFKVKLSKRVTHLVQYSILSSLIFGLFELIFSRSSSALIVPLITFHPDINGTQIFVTQIT